LDLILPVKKYLFGTPVAVLFMKLTQGRRSIFKQLNINLYGFQDIKPTQILFQTTPPSNIYNIFICTCPDMIRNLIVDIELGLLMVFFYQVLNVRKGIL